MLYNGNTPLKKRIIAVNKLGAPTAPSTPLLQALESESFRVQEAIRFFERRTKSFEDPRVSTKACATVHTKQRRVLNTVTMTSIVLM